MNTDNLNDVVLKSGAHSTRDEGVCAMEMVAWLAGEAHSDSPACTCPVIGAFVRRVNDKWDDANRQRLKPLLLKLVGTVDPSKEQARAYMAVDWAVREILPQWHDLAGLTDQAAALRALSPIVDEDSARAGYAAVEAAWAAAAHAPAAATCIATRTAARIAAAAASTATRVAARIATATPDAAWTDADHAAWAAAGAAVNNQQFETAGAAVNNQQSETAGATLIEAQRVSTLAIIERMVNAPIHR